MNSSRIRDIRPGKKINPGVYGVGTVAKRVDPQIVAQALNADIVGSSNRFIFSKGILFELERSYQASDIALLEKLAIDRKISLSMLEIVYKRLSNEMEQILNNWEKWEVFFELQLGGYIRACKKDIEQIKLKSDKILIRTQSNADFDYWESEFLFKDGN